MSMFQVLAILIDIWLYVILVCISMMKYDVNIFICLLSTCTSSLVSVFKGFLLIFKQLFIIEFKSSLYILNNRPLSDTSFAKNILPVYV